MTTPIVHGLLQGITDRIERISERLDRSLALDQDDAEELLHIPQAARLHPGTERPGRD